MPILAWWWKRDATAAGSEERSDGGEGQGWRGNGGGGCVAVEGGEFGEYGWELRESEADMATHGRQISLSGSESTKGEKERR